MWFTVWKGRLGHEQFFFLRCVTHDLVMSEPNDKHTDDEPTKVPEACFREYLCLKQKRRGLLRMWAPILGFSGLIKEFGCGRSQASRAMKEATKARANGWDLFDSSHFQKRDKKKCMATQLPLTHSTRSQVGCRAPWASVLVWFEDQSTRILVPVWMDSFLYSWNSRNSR